MVMNRKVFWSYANADDNDDANDKNNANADDNDAQPVLEPCSLQWVQPYREVHKCAHLPRLTIKTITNKDAAIFLLIIEEKVDLADKVN